MSKERPFEDITPVPNIKVGYFEKEAYLEIIDRQAKQIDEFAYQIMALQSRIDILEKNKRTQGEWIPVNERFPDDMQRVLIWFEYYRYGDYNCMYQTYGFCYVCDGKWSPFINGETGWQDARIIAWMPLPEAYKDEEND